MRAVESNNALSVLPRLQSNTTPASGKVEQSTSATSGDQSLIHLATSPHLLGPISGKLPHSDPAPLSSDMKAALAKMMQLLAERSQKASTPSKEQNTTSTPTKTEQKEQKPPSTPSPSAPKETNTKSEPAKKTTYVVKKGDSLSKIARNTLGNGDRWREIYDLNRDKISNPNTIFPGQELVLPGGKSQEPQKPSTPAPTSPAKATQPRQEAPKQTTYVVKKGDTLSKIASNTLGNANRWQEIYNLNRDKISNPNQISPGQELVLPGGSTKPTQQTNKQAAPSTQSSAGHLANSKSYFISQYRSSTNSQEDARNNGNCGPTSLTMVAMAFKKISVSPSSADQSIENTRQRMGAGTDQYSGTSYDQLVKGARSYGLDAKVVYGKLDTIQQELNKGRLVIAHVIPSYLNPNTTSTGHYTVVTRIADGKVYLNDPISTSGPVVVSAEKFLQGQKARGAYGLISIGD